jgi:hypothetical protein
LAFERSELSNEEKGQAEEVVSVAMKLVLAGYAADLLFGDLRIEIFLHHFFSLGSSVPCNNSHCAMRKKRGSTGANQVSIPMR